MISKVIGMAIIGLVLSLGSASIAEYLVSNYSTPIRYGHTIYRYGGKIPESVIINAKRKYDSSAAFNTFLYLGLLITLIVIIHVSNCGYIYQSMAYGLLFCITVGFGLGFYYAIENGQYDGNTTFYMKFSKQYLNNSIYIGLGFAALIFGVNLTNKKPTT